MTTRKGYSASTRTRKTKSTSNRGQGYSVEAIDRESGVRYRATVWDAARQCKVPVENEATGTKSFDHEYEAHAAAQALKKRIDGTYTDAGVPVQRQRQKWTFEQYADLWVETQGGAAATRRYRKSVINQAKKRFEKLLLAEITEDHVLAWDRASEDAGLAYGTRSSRVNYLRRLFAKAVKAGLIDTNPCAEIKFRKPKRKGAIRRLGADEFATLLTHMPEWVRVAALLAYDTGLRAGEVAGLRWERVILDGPRPYVLVREIRQYDGTLKEHTKSGGDRKVALTPRLVDALRTLKASRLDGPDDFVVRSRRNTAIAVRTPNEQLAKAFEKSGLGGVRPKFHHLRHACLADIVDATGNVRAAQAVAGHADLGTTQAYLDEVTLDTQAEVMAAREAKAKARTSVVVEIPERNKLVA